MLPLPPPDPDESTRTISDPIDRWLLAYEEAMNHGDPPPSIPPEIVDSPRLIEGRRCIDQLRSVFAAPPSVDWEDQVIRTLAAGHMPERIGRFSIIRELGRGGCGIVFLATDPVLDRAIALKVPRPEILLSAPMLRRFLFEARAAAVLNHPGIIAIHETSETGPLAYIAASYCSGPTLAQWLLVRHPANVQAISRLILHLAEAIQHAHDRGILHRDIKPSNILLEPKSADDSSLDSFAPMLSDFGLAKMLQLDTGTTRTGQILGTPTYMSPEQARGELSEITASSDVYSLGAVLYELLTGQPPFVGGTDLDVLRQVVHDDPVPPSKLHQKLPTDLEAICLKCLEKSPDDRYRTAGDLAEDLQRFLGGMPTLARPLGKIRTAYRWARRHKTATALISLVIAFLCIGAIGSGLYNHHLEQLNQSLERTNQRLHTETEIARERGRELRLTIYADQIRFAARHLEANDLTATNRLLDLTQPRLGDEDLREFAWNYLHRQLHLDRKTIQASSQAIYRLTASPDHTLLAAAGKDGLIRLFNLASGELHRELRGHENEVNGIVFSPDGKHLYSGSDDRTIRRWNIETGECTQILNGHDRNVLELRWLPDGKHLLSAGLDGKVLVWEPQLGTIVRSIQLSPGTDVGTVSNDGSWMVSGNSRAGELSWWDTLTGEVTHRSHIAIGTTRLLACSRTRSLISYSRDRMYEIANPKDPLHLLDHMIPRVSRGVVSLDDRYILLGTMDGALWVIDRHLHHQPIVLHAHSGRIWDILLDHDGSSIYTCSEDGTIKHWEWERIGKQQFATLPGRAHCGDFIPDRPWIVIGGNESPVQLWDYERKIPLTRGASNPYQFIDLTYSASDGCIYAADQSKNTIHRFAMPEPPLPPHSNVAGLMASGLVWMHQPMRDLGPIYRLPHQPLSLESSVDGRSITATTDDGEVLTGNIGPSGELETRVVPEQRMLRTIVYHPYLPLMAYSGVEGRIIIWNDAEKREIQRLPGHRRDLTCLAFSPDGTRLASAGGDRVISLWDWQKGEVERSFVGHREEVLCISFSPDGKNLASCSVDGTIRIWQVITAHELLQFLTPQHHARWIGFAPNGSTLVAICPSNKTYESNILFYRCK